MLILISVLVAVAALFGWISSRVLKMPNTIGTMLLTAVSSISLVLLARVWPEPHDWVLQIISQVDFERLILHGMLSLLLFAGASLLDLDALREQKLAVGLLATLSTIISIVGVGVATYYAARAFGFHASLIEALLFGAIISPTDPIAVLEMLRRVQTPKFLEAQLAGESLFNDGVGCDRARLAWSGTWRSYESARTFFADTACFGWWHRSRNTACPPYRVSHAKRPKYRPRHTSKPRPGPWRLCDCRSFQYLRSARNGNSCARLTLSHREAGRGDHCSHRTSPVLEHVG